MTQQAYSGKPTEHISGPNHQGRRVYLESHPYDTDVTIRASAPDQHHATIAFHGYWHNADLSMRLAELAQVRDAITSVLIEAGFEEAPDA